MSDDVAALRAEVSLLRYRLHALEQTVRQLSRRRLDPLADADRSWLVQLLPAIAAATGGAVWALPDLAALALLPGNDALSDVLAPHMGRAGGLRGLGKALSRCADHAVNGFELRQVGICRDGILWQCVFENRESRAADCAAESSAATIA